MMPMEILNESTLIPLSVGAAIVIAAISYTLWLGQKFSTLTDKIGTQGTSLSKEMTSQGNDLRMQIQEVKFLLAERFTKEEFRRWEREFFRANPGLKSPEDAP